MTYEAGIYILLFVLAVLVICEFMRNSIGGDVADDELLSRDDVLELAAPIIHDLPDFPGDVLNFNRTKPDGKWHPHTTDTCPVSLSDDVVVMWRDGLVSNILPACELRWCETGSDYDILAYRIA